MGSRSHVLRASPQPGDDAWRFADVPPGLLAPGPRNDSFWGKAISFKADAITLRRERLTVNRVLAADDPAMFVAASFEGLRSPEFTGRVAADYMIRLFKEGLWLNGVQYRFYGHSNSQLRGRSCWLRQANNDQELDARIYQLGELSKIMNIAKRAKRIGLLFSTADIDAQLDPARTTDIPDIKIGDELFSDGCGLMSVRLATNLAKAKKIVFRGKRYTPAVFQIRYRGYKGVLALHPELRATPQVLAQFRASMRKFAVPHDMTFSVVDHSKPYAFGRLNNDIVVLLSSLGVSNDALLAKQRAYFAWIARADEDADAAVDFLSCTDRFDLAERVLLHGLDDARVLKEVRGAQAREVGSFGGKRGKTRVRMILKKSRLLFGVCDPHGVLEEGEVHVRITSPTGSTTLHETDVLVVRNPCLHPGDCLKLRAVYRKELAHLVDCVVFAGKGLRAAPSMTSGGDLDGDKFLICWDPDIVPTRLMRSYDYPPNKEHTSAKVTRQDLARHFASYNTSGLARVAALHQKWAWNAPEGALCTQCLELNALHSQSVDGARVVVPERLLSPPVSAEPYIIDLLVQEAEAFAQRFQEARAAAPEDVPADTDADAEARVVQILSMERSGISEYEAFLAAARIARTHGIDLRRHLALLDFGALTAAQKHAVSFALGTRPDEDRHIWNSLFRSNILTARDLRERNLDRPLRLQRLYTSREAGTAAFFEYLHMAASNYVRKLIILKTDERFAVGVFIRGELPWDEEPEVADNVAVCSFMKHGGDVLSTYQTCTRGYRLHCGDGIFQLYNKHRGDTFIFLNRPPPRSDAFVSASIALQKISTRVQKQVGRLNRNAVVEIEIHVVSNRDREAHQLFDLRFDHVRTEEFIKQQLDLRKTYVPNRLSEVDWTEQPEWMQELFNCLPDDRASLLGDRSISDLAKIVKFCETLHEQDLLFESFHVMIEHDPLSQEEVVDMLKVHPPLVFSILKIHPPDDDGTLPPAVDGLLWPILQMLMCTANGFSMAVLVALEKLESAIRSLPVHRYCELLELAALCIRAPGVVQEVLLVLNDTRMGSPANTAPATYAHAHALGVAFERAEEAAEECPCDENGKPAKQRTSPPRVRLHRDKDAEKDRLVRADIRLDFPSAVRLHSLVRLQAASKPEKGWVTPWAMDGTVVQAQKGELKIELLHPAPAEMEQMDWLLFNAGSIANAQAMMDAVTKISTRGVDRCRFATVITGQTNSLERALEPAGEFLAEDATRLERLNDSQRQAVFLSKHPLSLIWGPPGTGKTTVVIEILVSMLRDRAGRPTSGGGEDDDEEKLKLLVTASTHNAVDNILERFIRVNDELRLVPENVILRVATDVSKVNKKLLGYTVSAQVGDVQQDVKLLSVAQKRVRAASVVFTTCAGAGLGSLRSLDFSDVVVDEASQVTEPTTLIPLVKGCKRAVLVGDHVQLRPMVRPMAKALEHDRSLLERLYTDTTLDIPRTMLDVQYRFPQELAAFPSTTFYEGRLRTGTGATPPLSGSCFPWPVRDGRPFPVVFVPCATEEDTGGSSKSNAGQAQLVAHIICLLRTPENEEAGIEELGITALTPYTKQAKALRGAISSRFDVQAYTIDSFQGREDDIVIFSTVRCNVHDDIGFVEDARRLNVAWTRAKRALIIVGDKKTMTTNSSLWKQAIEACMTVIIEVPEQEES